MVNHNITFHAALVLAMIGCMPKEAESFTSVMPAVVRPAFHSSSLRQQIPSFHEQWEVIDECAVSGQPSDNLYDCIRQIDRNATKLYPDISAKDELWDRAHGSWKLQLATGGGRYTAFKPVPIFAYAMIDEKCFGNGVGLTEDTIILSLKGPHHFNAKRRQMGIGIDDVYLFSNEVTKFMPDFMTDGMGLGKTPEDYRESKSRMPTFTMIGASDRSLIARGGSGGIAIWTRLEKDIRPAAYGMDN